MYESKAWLRDMRLLLARFGKDEEENLSRSIARLLGFMDASDLEGTGLSSALALTIGEWSLLSSLFPSLFS